MLVLLFLDLVVKAWAARTLPGVVPQPVVPGLVALDYTLNPGMAWGLLGGLSLPLAGGRLLVGMGLVVMLLQARVRWEQQWPLALIAAGALGNAVDGLVRGAVVDYLTSPLLDRLSQAVNGQPFPIFNLADILVCTGVLWLAIQGLWTQRREQAPTTAPALPSKEKP